MREANGVTGRYRYNLVLVYLGLTLAVVWVAYEMSRPVWAEPSVAAEIHQQVIAGTADYPHQFRPLVPWLCEAMRQVGVPLKLAYLLQRASCWFLAVLLFHVYCRRWLPEPLCLAGGAILLAILPFSLLGQGFQPTDPLNLLLYFAAYLALAERRDLWLFWIVGLGMLNRETIGLVVLLTAAVRMDAWRTRQYWLLVGGLFLTAAVVYLGLHLGYGPRESFTELVRPAVNIPENLSRLGSARVLVIFGMLWVLASTGLREQPPFLRRSLILAPVFLLVHLCYGLLGETRYFLPLAPTIVPLGLRRLFALPEEAG